MFVLTILEKIKERRLKFSQGSVSKRVIKGDKLSRNESGTIKSKIKQIKICSKKYDDSSIKSK